MQPNIPALLSHFLPDPPQAVEQIHEHAWSVGNDYILKQNTDSDELRKSMAINTFLAAKGLPVPRYLPTAAGEPVVQSGGASYSLMTRLPGTHPDPFAEGSDATGEALGQAVAKLHTALAGFEPDFPFYDADLMTELSGWIVPALQKAGITFHDGVLEACAGFGPLYHSLPRQIIHRDIHTENLLFEGGRCCGYLDFDLSQKNARIFDLSYLGGCLLDGNTPYPHRLHLWQSVFPGLLAGYEELSPLSGPERQAIPLLMLLIEVLFTAFYAKEGQTDDAKSGVETVNWMYTHMDLIENCCRK